MTLDENNKDLSQSEQVFRSPRQNISHREEMTAGLCSVDPSCTFAQSGRPSRHHPQAEEETPDGRPDRSLVPRLRRRTHLAPRPASRARPRGARRSRRVVRAGRRAADAATARPATRRMRRRRSTPTGWKTVWLDHITYQCTDYKKAAAFYSAVMGWKVRSDDGKRIVMDMATSAASS